MIKRIYLEITDSCNLNCPFCTNEKGSSFMSLKDIKHSIDEISEVCDYIYLHVLGEPLMHPDFKAILEYLDLKQMNLQLVTNGTLLKNYPDILKHRCLRKLSVSLHSISNLEIQDSYYKTILKLIEECSDTKIELRFYDRNSLSHDLIDFLELLKKNYSFEMTEKKNSYQLKDNVYVYFEELFRWPSINDPVISKSGQCLGAKSQLAILHNLDVTICCLDPKGYNCIGSLKDQSLKSIIESENYLSVIRNFNNNKLSFELCQKCSYRQRFSKQ